MCSIPPISEEKLPFNIPKGWSWVRMRDICPNITSGTTPSKDYFTDSSGIPYLKVYNIRNNEIDFEYKEQYIAKEIHNTSNKRCILYPGDVIMNIVGPPLGKIAIIPDKFPEYNCNQAIVYFRPIIKEFNVWIYLFLSELSFLNYIELIGTAGQDNISVSKSQNIKIAIPPLNEQKRIVKKVDKLMRLCDDLEKEVKENHKNSELLMETVLREAFEVNKTS